MADHVAVSIHIGGSLDAAHLPDLLATITSDGATADWEGTSHRLIRRARSS